VTTEHDTTLIAVSAFSGLGGALLTQLLAGIFSAVNDKRKFRREQQAAFFNRKRDVGETYFYATLEMLGVLKKSVAFWKNRNESRSQTSLAYLSDGMKRAAEQMSALKNDTLKYNLAGLYFDLPVPETDISRLNERSHELFLQIIDLAEQIKNADSKALDLLYGRYNETIFKLCNHYEHVYQLVETNMHAVKKAVVGLF